MSPIKKISKARRVQESPRGKKDPRGKNSVWNVNNFFKKHKEPVVKRLVILYSQELIKGLKEFFYRGSLHGVKYIFMRNFSIIERVIWSIIVAISITICGFNITEFITKSSTSSFLVLRDQLPTAVSSVPFPVIILCSNLHVKLSYKNVSKLNSLEGFFASLVCPHMSRGNRKFSNRLTEKEQEKLQKFIINAVPKCSDIIKSCSWQNTNKKLSGLRCCKQLFKPLFTHSGLCYAFNSLPLGGMTNATLIWQKSFNQYVDDSHYEWNLDKDLTSMPSDLPLWINPGYGEENAFNIDLYLNLSERQLQCEGNFVGFTALYKPPTKNLYGTVAIRLQMSRIKSFEMTPTITKTEASLRSLAPEQRQCYFQDERRLHFYKYYSTANCRLDMWITQGSKQCSCALYNWPRENLSHPICSTEDDFKCIEAIRVKIDQNIFLAFTENSHIDHTNMEFEPCYPACNGLKYTVKTHYTDLMSSPSDYSARQNSTLKENTYLKLYYSDSKFFGLHRHRQHDKYYVVGAVGGILGLYLGFSLVTIAELLYFVVFKPIQNTIKEF